MPIEKCDGSGGGGTMAMLVLALCGTLGAFGVKGLASGAMATAGLLSDDGCFTGSGG